MCFGKAGACAGAVHGGDDWGETREGHDSVASGDAFDAEGTVGGFVFFVEGVDGGFEGLLGDGGCIRIEEVEGVDDGLGLDGAVGGHEEGFEGGAGFFIERRDL